MTTWLVSTQHGAATNGGTSIVIRSTGTDGACITAAGLTTMSSITAAWSSADVGHGFYASSGTKIRLISAVRAQQSMTITTASGNTTVTSAGLFDATMVGCVLTGPGLAANTIVTGFTDASHITVSAAAGAGFGTGTGVFGAKVTTTGTTNFTTGSGQTWTIGGMLNTLARTMVTASGIPNAYAAGDSIYVGAGTYRETVANTLSGAVTASGTQKKSPNGVTSTNGTTFTDSTAGAFTAGMVGKNIEIVAGGSISVCRISGYTSSSVMTIAPATAMGFPTTAYSSCTWQVGKVAIIGDVDGAKTGDAGQVTLTAYTTSDTAAPSATTELALAATHDLSFSADSP